MEAKLLMRRQVYEKLKTRSVNLLTMRLTYFRSESCLTVLINVKADGDLWAAICIWNKTENFSLLNGGKKNCVSAYKRVSWKR